MDNVREMVGTVRLHNPDVPYFLAVQWIRDRYRRALDMRHWVFQRKTYDILTETASTAGTVSLVRGSAAVLGIGSAFTVPMVGRQFMAGGRAPISTVAAVADATHLTLDRPWSGTTAPAAQYRIFSGYVTMPVGFRQFIAVLDPVRSWQLRFWVTQEELTRRDPSRTTAQEPTALADLGRDPVTDRAMFELWPYSLTEQSYLAHYFEQGADLHQPTDMPRQPIRGDILVRGALADLAMWPGTPNRPNPGFNLELCALREKEYLDLLDRVEVEDENISMTWLKGADWMRWPLAPIDARWMQNHAVTY